MPYRTSRCRSVRFRPPLLVAALAAATLLSLTSGVHAHRIDHTVSRQETVLVVLGYGPDEPVEDASYRVYGPGTGPAFTTGRTAADGSLAFKPDRPGTWRVTVTDEGGHGTVLRVEVADDEVLAEPAAPTPASDGPMLLAGVGYLFGIAGLLALWQARRLRG
jgi:nickel transport protein